MGHFLRVTEYWKQGCSVILKITQHLNNLRLPLNKLEKRISSFQQIVLLPGIGVILRVTFSVYTSFPI